MDFKKTINVLLLPNIELTLNSMPSSVNVTTGARFLAQGIPEVSYDQWVTIALVRLTDLGLKEHKVSVLDFWKRASMEGLSLCPAQLAIDLRSQYLDQPSSEAIRIAMDPILDIHRNRSIFEVRHDEEGLYLDTSYVNPESWFSAEGLWAFTMNNRLSPFIH